MSIETIKTPTVTLAFAKLSDFDTEGEKTSLAMIIPKDSPFVPIVKKYIEEAKEELYGNAAKISLPALKDGDEIADEYENMAGHYILNASTFFKVPLFDKYGSKIDDVSEFYNGCKVRVAIKAGAYTYEKKKGVKLYLNGLQFAADGERVGGGPSFEAIEEEDTDI